MIFMNLFGSTFCDFMREHYIQCLWHLDAKRRNDITAMKFNIYWAKDNRHTVYSLGDTLEGTIQDREVKYTCNCGLHLYAICYIEFCTDI